MKISEYIDHTLLRSDATFEQINQLCNEAIQHQFYAVCVNGCRVADCRELLAESGSSIKIASVIGFPLGSSSTSSKASEAAKAIADGAHELDVVINIGWLKDKNYRAVLSDLSEVRRACEASVLKVIIETCYLAEDEKISATKLVAESGADYIKTSTGFGTGGASIEDVLLMRKFSDGKLKIKASGGIRDYSTAKVYIEAGVSRIGTSNGIQIVTGAVAPSGNY